MGGYKRQGTFDDLNAALFAQMEKLANADKDNIGDEISRSDATQKLAGRIIENANTAISLMRLQAQEGMDMGGMVATAPKMLVGGQGERALAEPSWEVVDPFIAANAEGHTVGYLVDRLRRQGVDVSYESVERRCRELDVEPKRLSGSRDEYAEFRHAQAMEGRGDDYE